MYTPPLVPCDAPLSEVFQFSSMAEGGARAVGSLPGRATIADVGSVADAPATSPSENQASAHLGATVVGPQDGVLAKRSIEAPEPWSLLLDRLRVPVEGAARAAAARAVAGAGFDQLAGAIFDSLDADGSGALSRGELGRLAVAAAARSEGMLGVAVDASVGDIRALAAAYDAAREAAGLAAGAELTRRDAAAAVKMAVALLAVKASASGTLAAAASAGAVAEDAQSVAI